MSCRSTWKKTVHVFDKTANGGLQQVVAKNAGDVEQIRLIREHLSHIAARFTQGDFSGPARIHGNAMPGLAAMSAGAGQIRFVYGELPNGAQIDYSTDQPELVGAIHAYFDAQLSDHARHAVSGHHGRHHR
ncbi:aspartate carbamoyltransferase [Methylogaea oryzae]|uniref:aspartate carbamoyltransferase n=1 Tax=Methylogaea oryzae TaxID=1295382 RepID=UPI001FE78575|nr:aspartate carbamoyltransferase [Methylogaea oryzae]